MRFLLLLSTLVLLVLLCGWDADGKRTRKPDEMGVTVPTRSYKRRTTTLWFDPMLKTTYKWMKKAKELFKWILGYGPLLVPEMVEIEQNYQQFHDAVIDSQTHDQLQLQLVKLGRIAHFARLFKRFGRDMEETEGFMYRSFPNPIPHKLHMELQRNCTKSIFDCIDTANYYVKSSKWFSWEYFNDHYFFDTATNDQGMGLWRKVNRRDFYLHSEPFMTHYDRYAFAVTLSYYFCWYSMLRLSILQHLPYCGYTEKIHTSFIIDNDFDESVRDEVDTEPSIDVLDPIPFRCAKFSFCPNPCCRQTELVAPKCFSDPTNPCRNLVDKTCELEGHRNRDFISLVQNQFNISCRCGQGQTFNVQQMVCMDIDECADDTYYCPQPNTVCVNTVGSYTCACRLGFIQKVDGLATFCEEITKPLHYRNYEV